MSTLLIKQPAALLAFLKARPAMWIAFLAVAAALLIGLLLVHLIGVPIGDAVAAFAEGAWGSPYAIAASINRSLVFALVGLGFVLADRANLTNVGGEGQIAIGGIVATAVSLYGHVSDLPFGLAFLLPLLAASLAGGLWGGLAGVLKARAGTNEVIATLLLSFIAVWMVYGSVQSVALLRQPMTHSNTLPESLEIPDPTKLPLLTDDYSMPLHSGLLFGFALAIVVALVLNKTVFGLRLRAVGLNPLAARRAGIAISASVVGVLFAAGALGGLAGACMLQGEQYSLKAGFSSGYGFDGLVVGLLARGSVVGVIAGALLFGFLRSGGINMEMVAAVPTALVVVIQGLIIVILAGAALSMQRWEVER
ncbi:ABC transporter permease [Uliginosibacterium sediminicola]|uniref:ABC transporter permease n=1 Tax=Uliginosibacterium sediminicola TaxID=2024550 RepID=A0ABU9YUB4_9RHOO